MPTQADAMKYAIDAANKYGVDPATFLGLVQAESSWNPFAQPRNKDGTLQSSAYGYTQLLRGTAGDLKVDRTDWRQNLDGGAKYLAQMIKSFGGNVGLGVAAYHDGAGNVRRKGVSADGSDYQAKVAGYAKQFSASGIAGSVRSGADTFLSGAWNAIAPSGLAIGNALSAPGDLLDKGLNSISDAVTPDLNAWLGRIAIIVFAFIFIAAGLFMIAPRSVTQVAGKVVPGL